MRYQNGVGHFSLRGESEFRSDLQRDLTNSGVFAVCGRFFRHGVTWDEYASALELIVPDGMDAPEAAYNAAPMSWQPVLRQREHGKSGVEMVPALWGLVPSWWTKPLSEKKFTTFNARAEGLNESNTFRGAFRYRRCLVPVSGFYEWTGPVGRKMPFAIGLRNRRWFCFAGLWDRALIDGSEVETFTIVTTTPNDLMAGLHTRMPVILEPADYAAWLDPSRAGVEQLFQPFPSDAMHAWPVGKAVGNVKNQGIELIAEA